MLRNQLTIPFARRRKPALALGLTLLGTAPVLAQTHATAVKPTLPAGVAGRWIATTSSATTYWNQNNQYLGNGSQNGQIYEFDGQGGFTYYLLMEVRTGHFVSKVHNFCKGTVTFTANTFTLRPASGHYHTEIGGNLTDRAMTAEDLARVAKTLSWRLEQGADGKPRFITPFKDGSKSEFRPLPDAPKAASKK